MPRAKSYDPACYTLAAYFLGDIAGATDTDHQELARALQEACEDACNAVEARCTCRTPTARATDISPPEPIRDPECPCHGSPRDPDARMEEERG